MQELRRIGFVAGIDNRALSFLETQQWPWELTVVERSGIMCSGASSASVFSPFTAAKATFALKDAVWFRRGLLLIVSPE